MNVNNEKRWYQKWWVWLIILFLIGSILNKKNENNSTNTINSSSSINKGSCSGSESCIDKVRQNFTNTGKQILSEHYLGNGKFGISFLDISRGQTYNSEVSTDCNCNILNVNVHLMR